MVLYYKCKSTSCFRKQFDSIYQKVRDPIMTQLSKVPKEIKVTKTNNKHRNTNTHTCSHAHTHLLHKNVYQFIILNSKTKKLKIFNNKVLSELCYIYVYMYTYIHTMIKVKERKRKYYPWKTKLEENLEKLC